LAIAGAGLTRVLVPKANVVEASQVGGLDVIGARSLRHVVALLRGESPP
jgi:magnesium chelatase family protein